MYTLHLLNTAKTNNFYTDKKCSTFQGQTLAMTFTIQPTNIFGVIRNCKSSNFGRTHQLGVVHVGSLGDVVILFPELHVAAHDDDDDDQDHVKRNDHARDGVK